MKIIKFYFLLIAIAFAAACSSSKSASTGSTSAQKSSSEQENPAIDLVDHLSRIPGIQVTGSGSSARVAIRGMSSMNTDVEPLIVVNGTPVSGGVTAANSSVLVSNIKSVRVLKTPGEIAFYGSKGSSGVIVIQLKQ